MKILKGEVLEVNHTRKGKFKAIARENFDSDKTDWYPLILAPSNFVQGMVNVWEDGDIIPCRNSFCQIKRLGK